MATDVTLLPTGAAATLDNPLNEVVPGIVTSALINVFDYGQVRGTVLPTLSTRRSLKFAGVSNKNDATLVSVLRSFYEGSPIRVYRDWPGVLTPWSTTNLGGYDDILAEVEEHMLPWFGSTQDRFTFDLAGTEIA